MTTSKDEAIGLHVKWACPKCGLDADGHSLDKADECIAQGAQSCMGFICECEDEGESATHGTTYADPCKAANCYHCGWGGTFPRKPKGLAPFEKKALAAGWTPPENRRKELGLSDHDQASPSSTGKSEP